MIPHSRLMQCNACGCLSRSKLDLPLHLVVLRNRVPSRRGEPPSSRFFYSYLVPLGRWFNLSSIVANLIALSTLAQYPLYPTIDHRLSILPLSTRRPLPLPRTCHLFLPPLAASQTRHEPSIDSPRKSCRSTPGAAANLLPANRPSLHGPPTHPRYVCPCTSSLSLTLFCFPVLRLKVQTPIVHLSLDYELPL